LSKALAAATARFLVVSFTSDWRFRAAALARDRQGAARQPPRRLLRGDRRAARHDAFLLDDPRYHSLFSVVRAYFDGIFERL